MSVSEIWQILNLDYQLINASFHSEELIFTILNPIRLYLTV